MIGKLILVLIVGYVISIVELGILKPAGVGAGIS